MKSRKEPFSDKEKKIVDRKLDNNTTAVNKAIQDTNVIQNLRDNKADKTELSSYAKTTDLTKGLGSKLNTSDFGTKLAEDATIKGLQTGVSTLNTDVSGLKTGVSTLNTDVGGLKTGVSALNTAVGGLSTGKLDTSVYQSDLKSIPTMNNINSVIGSTVDSKVSEKVGTIQTAKGDYEKAYKDFSTNASALKTDLTTVAGNLKSDFNTFAGNLTGDFNLNVNTQTAAFNRNYNDKYGTIKALKIAAETAKADAVAAKTEAVNAQVESKKIYNDVFGEVSGRVITQSNTYRSGLKINPDYGVYDLSFNPDSKVNETFSTIEGMTPDAVFTLEKQVITDINNFNTAYYALISCKTDSKLCKATLSTLESNLTNANVALSNSIQNLQTQYLNINETDMTQALLDRAAQIDDLRQDLDAKMARILESKNPPNEMTQQLDSTVYAGILWSVLGTSLLYYIFTE